MSGYDPGPGWREVERPEAAMHGEVVSYRAPRGDEPRVRTWVREALVSPLPTEPGWYVALESLNSGGAVVVELLASPAGQWVDASDRQYLDLDLNIRPLGPLTRLEPRAVTAKAVLEEAEAFFDRAWNPGQMRVLSYDTQEALFARVRDRFGVES